MTTPAYSAARQIASRVHNHFANNRTSSADEKTLAPLPSEEVIESIIDVAFWTSLRREEQYPPRISLSYVPPEQVTSPMLFAKPLNLHPEALTKIAPGVERPGIHLGVWRIDGELKVWGAARNLPPFAFITETVAPGLLVIKHRRNEGSAKFVNVAVLEGDQIKILNHEFPDAPGCASILGSLLGTTTLAPTSSESSNVLIRLAVSMRDHKRGGSLLVVPRGDDGWKRSISQPMSYSVDPPYTELSSIVKEEPADGSQRRWRDALVKAVDAVAGLTAIDGATVINQECEVLAFGAKIIRTDGVPPAETVALVEPTDGSERQVIPIGQLGGTRHMSAAQFANAQKDAISMVASQDGPFTIFSWSSCDRLVYGYRVETLLL